MTEALFPYVVISLAAARTGLSVAAIEKKIAAGHWIEGRPGVGQHTRERA